MIAVAETKCERCGFYASEPPLCGYCKSEIALQVWADEKERDRYMDAHPQNPANLPDPTNAEQQRHEDGYTYEQWRDTGTS